MVRNGRARCRGRRQQAGRGKAAREGGGTGAGGRHSKTAPPPGCKWPTKNRPAILRGVLDGPVKRRHASNLLPHFCLVFSKANKDVKCATCASKQGS
jgi:hypothetical protein